MDDLLAILSDIAPDVDFEHETGLVDDGILDSFAILSLVGEREDTYDIRITPKELIPVNFNSAEAIFALVERLRNA